LFYYQWIRQYYKELYIEDEALFGGINTQEMKRKLNIPISGPLADFLPTITIKSKDLATKITSHNIIVKDLICLPNSDLSNC
jgi:hypothetical protein